MLMTAHYVHILKADLQELCNHFAEAARLFGLTINLSKTEVMHQRPPRDESVNQETSIKIGNVSLKEVPTFVYLGSTLSNDAMLDHEIATRIKKACSSFGRLYDRVWKNHGLTIPTKVRVYEAVVLTILLYGSETWILYRKAREDVGILPHETSTNHSRHQMAG